MVKKISSSLVASNATSSKALERILALRAEVSRLRHHVSILSKRLHKLDPPGRKDSHADSSPSPVIEEDILQPDSGGKAVEEEGVAEELPLVAGEELVVALGEAVAEAEAVGEGSAGSVEVAEAEVVAGEESKLMEVDGRVVDLRSRISDKDIVVGGRIAPLEGYRPERSEWGVVPPRYPRGRGRTGAPIGPSRGRGLRFVDTSLVETHNVIVGNTYYTRGVSARALGRGGGGDFVFRGR